MGTLSKNGLGIGFVKVIRQEKCWHKKKIILKVWLIPSYHGITILIMGFDTMVTGYYCIDFLGQICTSGMPQHIYGDV